MPALLKQNRTDATPQIALATEIRGQEISCQLVRGKVIGLRSDSRTRIYSTFDAATKSTRVNSYVETRTDFHVQTAEGVEKPYSHYFDIPLRDHHEVTNVHVQLGQRRSLWVLLVNHTTRQFWYMYKPTELVFRMGALWRVRWWSMILVFLPFLLIALAVGKGGEPIAGIGLFVAVGAFVCGKTIQWARAMLLWRKLKPELEDVVQSLLQRV